jgi:hypothetical protein
MSLLLQWRQFSAPIKTPCYAYSFPAIDVRFRHSSASLLSQQRLPAQYMQTTEDAAIWAQVGNSVINVGNVRAGQILRCACGGGLL